MHRGNVWDVMIAPILSQNSYLAIDMNTKMVKFNSGGGSSESACTYLLPHVGNGPAKPLGDIKPPYINLKDKAGYLND